MPTDPILWHCALEVCNLDKMILQSLINFTVKLFKTSNIDIVQYCQTLFRRELPYVLLVKTKKRYEKFTEKLIHVLCLLRLVKVF